METKKEFTAMDFLTFTVGGNVVMTDPVTGKDILCLRQPDNKFVHPNIEQPLTPEEICALLELRIEQAQRMDAENEAKAQAAAQQTPPPPPVPPASSSTPPPVPPQGDAPTPKFCGSCGAPLVPGCKFCTKCGQPV